MPSALTYIIIEAIQKTNNNSSEDSVLIFLAVFVAIFVAYGICWCKYIKWQSEISQK